MHLGQIPAGGAQLLPQVGHRVDAQHLHPQVGQAKHTAHHIVEHRGIAVVQVPLVGVEGGAHILAHLLHVNEAARRGLREYVGDGLFHLPGDIRAVEANVTVDVLPLARLGPHRPFVGVGGVVDDKIQAQAHPPPAHGCCQGTQVLIRPQRGVHLVKVLHGVAAIVVRVRHFQQGHQVHIGNPLLLEVTQPLLHPLEVSGEQPRIHSHPQHFARPEPVRLRLPLFIQTPQRLAARPPNLGHHDLQFVQAGPVAIQLHIQPVQLVLPGGQTALQFVHAFSSSISPASSRRTCSASGILRKAPFRVVTK